MLAEVSDLLESIPYDVVSLQGQDASSSCFLLLHFIAEAAKKNTRLILLASTRSERAYRVIASKAMVRLINNMRFISVSELFVDGLDADDAPFLNRLREAILHEVDNGSDDAFVLFDNLSLLSDVLRNPGSLVAFLRQLQISIRAKGVHPKLILTLQSKCDVSAAILHKSDFVLRTKLIGSGFTKDITGQLMIIPSADQKMSATVMHYHLGDRSVRLFFPGLLRPSL